MRGAAELTRVFTLCEFTAESLIDFAGGSVAVYSAAAPGGETENQDGAAFACVGPRTSDWGILAVADGLGGQRGGASAAGLALTCLLKAVSTCPPDRPSRGVILDAIERANQAVIGLGIGAATTLSVAEISGNILRPYHIGDSSILVVGQRGRLKLRTMSHSPVGYALEAGLLDEDEAMHHAERHLISNTVGAADMRIEVGSPVVLAPRDTVVLATDGITDNLSPAEIAEIVRAGPLEEAASRLATACEDRMRGAVEGSPSKLDDATFILFRSRNVAVRSESRAR